MTVHHYQHHVGDYAAHTGHLSVIEDCAYRRMLDLYYLHERPLNGTATDVARAIRMREHPLEVEAVLREFFRWEEARGWVQDRAEREIAAYSERRRDAAKAGRASGRARRQGASERSTDVQRPLNGTATVSEPTGNREPVPSTQPPNPPERAVARGADASRDPEPEQRDPVVALQQALLRTGLRSKLPWFDRTHELMAIAEMAISTGLTPGHTAELWKLARDKGDNPGGLLDAWISRNTWREALDEQGRIAKERDARTRVRAVRAEDPLAGVYGDNA